MSRVNYARRTNGRRTRVSLADLTVIGRELLLPIQTADILAELRYDPARDRIYWKPTGVGIERRKLLSYYRGWRRRLHGQAKGSQIYLGPVILRTPQLRPLLEACSLYRRQYPWRKN